MFLHTTLPWSMGAFVIITSLLATVFNSMLLPIILFRSGQQIGQYKYLLFLYTLSSTIYSVLAVIQVPGFMVDETGFVFHSISTIVNQPYAFPCLVIYISCYVQIVIILNISFLYRYAVMSNSRLITLFTNPYKITMMTIISMSVVLYMITIVMINQHPTPEKDLLYNDRIYNLYGINVSTAGYAGAPIFINDNINYGMLNVLMTYSVIVMFTVVFVGTLIYKILKAFKRTTSMMGAKSNNFHKKLFLLLILQSVFPVLFTFLPAFTAFILAMLQWKCDQLVSILGIFMGVAQMIDPLLVVYLITDYRKFVFGKFGTSTVHTITNSDSLRGHFH